MREIRPVRYDEYGCTASDEVICPYCEHRNEMEIRNEEQQEQYETECDECGKTFMYSCNFSVTFDTEPLENYYITERKGLVKRLECYEKSIEQYNWQKEMALKMKHDIERLDKRIEKILEDETDEEETEISAAIRA